MLRWLKSIKLRRRVATDLYEKIVAQARSAAFFRDQCVPDTMEGRFEMIALHVVLVLQRLKAEGDAGQRLGQKLMELLVADMDDALRQIGIGDMGVPRRIQKTAAALRERAVDYQSALSEPDGAKLQSAVKRHVFGVAADDASTGRAITSHASAIAAYLSRVNRHLTTITWDALQQGGLTFPEAPMASGIAPEAP